MRHRFGSERPQGRAGDEMALQVEGIMDGGVDAEKSLRGAGRFEPLHLALSPSHDLMRVLGAVVHAQPLFVPTGQTKSLERSAVGAELVRDRQLRRKSVLAKQLAHQPHSCPLVPARLDQDVENLAPLVDGAPQVHAYSCNAHRHFIEMPSIPWSRLALPQSAGEKRTELQHPAPDRFIGQVEPTFGKKLLDVAVAEGEAQIEPDGVLDD